MRTEPPVSLPKAKSPAPAPGAERVRGEPVRAPSSGAVAGNVVHVLDGGAEAGERPVIRPDHGRIQIVGNESRARANCRHAGSGFMLADLITIIERITRLILLLVVLFMLNHCFD